MISKQLGKRSSRAVRVVGYTLICLPIMASFLYVREYGVNVPFTDIWRMVPYFEKLFNGDLRPGDLWELHSGEHRPFLPRVFLLLMGPLANFNMVTIMYATQFCLLTIFGGIFVAYRNTVGSDNKSLFFAIPISLLVFSLSQYWNMLHAWSIHVVVVNSFAILSFLLLSRLGGKPSGKKVPLFLAAILGGSAATLSAGHGLMVWPIGLLQLLIEPVSRGSKKYLMGVWGLIGALHWVVYFWNFESPNIQNPSGRVSSIYFFDSPMLGLDFFLGLSGFSILSNSRLVITAGAMILALFVFVMFQILKDRDQGKYTFWISISVFSLVVLAATTVGRAGKELDGTVQSKYVTFSVLLTIGVYVMALKLSQDHSPSEFYTLAVGICFGLIILSVPISYYSSVLEAREIKLEREEKACILIYYKNVPNKTLQQAFKPLRDRPEIGREIREGATTLDDLNYTVFALSVPEAEREFGCNS